MPKKKKPAAGKQESYTEKLDVRPGMGILRQLRGLDYEPWRALGEFVDNSLQSFFDHQKFFKKKKQNLVTVTIKIEKERGRGVRKITIEDDAGGIHTKDIQRAFLAGEAPEDTSGLNEFGVGMKSASVWFAEILRVRTSAVGEPIKRDIVFDFEKAIKLRREKIKCQVSPEKKNTSYTKIELTKIIRGFKIPSLIEHLTEIFREFMRKGQLKLVIDIDGEKERLKYDEVEILDAPEFTAANRPVGKKQKWKRSFKFTLPGRKGYSVRCWVAIRAVASHKEAGLSLFRKNRLISGSVDKKYRPENIFGDQGGYRYQRLFGEIHLADVFEVTANKGGFAWTQEVEDEFIEEIFKRITGKQSLLSQAKNYRAKQNPKTQKKAAQRAINKGSSISEKTKKKFKELKKPKPKKESKKPKKYKDSIKGEAPLEIETQGAVWEITSEAISKPLVDDWIQIYETPTKKAGRIKLKIIINIAHPFMEHFFGDGKNYEAIFTMARAYALAERAGVGSGVSGAESITELFNEHIRLLSDET